MSQCLFQLSVFISSSYAKLHIHLISFEFLFFFHSLLSLFFPVYWWVLFLPLLDYDFGDIFPVLQSLPSADWEGGTWLFPPPQSNIRPIHSSRLTNKHCACPSHSAHVCFTCISCCRQCICNVDFIDGLLWCSCSY